MLRKLFWQSAITLAIYAALLFGLAGTLDWWRAWVYLGVSILVGIVTIGWLYAYNKPLLEERLRSPIQKGQPLADKVVLILFMTLYAAWIAFIPLDVFHWHLLPKPDVFMSSLGLVLQVFGSYLVFLAMRDNTFAAPVIKHQESREHHVVDTGVYAFVRHPMYAGLLPLLVGTSLWLESYAAVLFGLLMVAILVVRIFLEESFLRRSLPGYDAYMQKVRYRLIPFVW
jgi:protein-S-isoprenylcysteine O-methyltransferase Ste14